VSQPTTPGPTTSAPETTTSTLASREAFAPVTATNVLWYGDSIAADMWPPFAAALEALGIDAASGAFGGVGLTVSDGVPDPIGRIAERIATHSPDLIVMPLSLWDAYATPTEQEAGLQALVGLTGERGLPLVLITIPVRSPDAADPGEAAYIARVRSVADRHRERVLVLDVGEVFGDEFAFDLDGDGTPERKRDGVHLCPTGALAVTTWLLDQLSRHVDGLRPPTSTEWVVSGWRTDARYDDPPGACAAL
jgi:lysophospholipase L1-like esterase